MASKTPAQVRYETEFESRKAEALSEASKLAELAQELLICVARSEPETGIILPISTGELEASLRNIRFLATYIRGQKDATTKRGLYGYRG